MRDLETVLFRREHLINFLERAYAGTGDRIPGAKRRGTRRCNGYGTTSGCCLPVVAISQSKSQMDMKQAYDMGASSYLLKPGSFAGLVELVKIIDRFWLTLNQVPGA